MPQTCDPTNQITLKENKDMDYPTMTAETQARPWLPEWQAPQWALKTDSPQDQGSTDGGLDEHGRPAWLQAALVYHIFPLGALGAEHENPWNGRPEPWQGEHQPQARIRELADWIPHWKSLGVDTLLLGPIWHSESHGYDTIELGKPDPRLGNEEDFLWTFRQLKQAGFRLLLDAVFNHVGRSFPGFRDVQEKREHSAYRHWFAGLDFRGGSPYGDNIHYETWDGHWNLVKLRMDQEEVRRYLLDQCEYWIRHYGIDGIRLDAADTIDPAFWPLLRSHCQTIKPDFWLYGEQVFGDYRSLAGPQSLHGATNYECYKGFWSSANDANMHEVAYALKRQFQDPGIYRHLSLLNFLDNHDVNRIASVLTNPAHLYPLHILLTTLPGVPAIYYGSEAGIPGRKNRNDWPLRPRLRPENLHQAEHPNLMGDIARLVSLRRQIPALSRGNYHELSVGPDWLVFQRGEGSGAALVILSLCAESRSLAIPLPPGHWHDHLNGGSFSGSPNSTNLEIPGHWGRILVRA